MTVHPWLTFWIGKVDRLGLAAVWFGLETAAVSSPACSALQAVSQFLYLLVPVTQLAQDKSHQLGLNELLCSRLLLR